MHLNDELGEKFEFFRDLYKRFQDNVINYSNKMDNAVNWSITITAVLIGLQWTFFPYQIFLYVSIILILSTFLKIDVFRYRNLVMWRDKTMKLQNTLQAYTSKHSNEELKIDISKLDSLPYNLTISWRRGFFQRLYRVYLSLYWIIFLNSIFCSVIRDLIELNIIFLWIDLIVLISSFIVLTILTFIVFFDKRKRLK